MIYQFRLTSFNIAQAFVEWFADNSWLLVTWSVLKGLCGWSARQVYGHLFKDHVKEIVKSLDPTITPSSPRYLLTWQIALTCGLASLPEKNREELEDIAKRWNREGPSWSIKQQ